MNYIHSMYTDLNPYKTPNIPYTHILCGITVYYAL